MCKEKIPSKIKMILCYDHNPELIWINVHIVECILPV